MYTGFNLVVRPNLVVVSSLYIESPIPNVLCLLFDHNKTVVVPGFVSDNLWPLGELLSYFLSIL